MYINKWKQNDNNGVACNMVKYWHDNKKNYKEQIKHSSMYTSICLLLSIFFTDNVIYIILMLNANMTPLNFSIFKMTLTYFFNSI